MIITFARLQRLSTLQKKTSIKRWLQKRQIPYLTDASGAPFTTLEALNSRLQRKVEDHEASPDYAALAQRRANRVRSVRPLQKS